MATGIFLDRGNGGKRRVEGFVLVGLDTFTIGQDQKGPVDFHPVAQALQR